VDDEYESLCTSEEDSAPPASHGFTRTSAFRKKLASMRGEDAARETSIADDGERGSLFDPHLANRIRAQELQIAEQSEVGVRNVRAASDARAISPGALERGFALFVTNAFLTTLQASRRLERTEEKVKVTGHLVVAWVINSSGEPVGPVVEWCAKTGMTPVWNSAKAISGVMDVTKCRLCIELWEELEGSLRVQLAGPAVLPLTALPLETTRIEVPRRRCDSGVLYIYTMPLMAPTVKEVFLIRHGESRWNAAKRKKRYDKMMKEHDHPLNEVGYRQALELQEAIRAAMMLENTNDNAAITPQIAAARQLIECEAFWSSPLTRALQTALVVLEPLLAGSRLELKANVRERKNWGGLDSIGRVTGVMCHQRALEELRELDENDCGPKKGEVEKLARICVDPLEVQEEWWSDGVESDKDMEKRLLEFLDQVQYSPHTRIVVVAHSHLFRTIFKKFLHPCYCMRAPETALRLQSTSIPNGTVLHCTMDFTLRAGGSPYVIKDVKELMMGSPKLSKKEAKANADKETKKGGRLHTHTA